MKHPVIIVGAGLAGLCCARHLQSQGISALVLETSDAVGGRIRTDRVEGYCFDRGFQVLLSSYPELKRWLDLDRLQLSAFLNGARIRYQGRFYDLADPWRRPLAGIASLFNPIGSISDKLRIARLRSKSLAGSYSQRMHDPEMTSQAYLERLGFSSQMLNSFLRPFLGGIFLDPELTTSSRMLNFVFRMFSQGQACLPARGMQAIPEQLAQGLAPDQLRLNTTVAALSGRGVQLADGADLQADCVVVAVDGPAAVRLLPGLQVARGRRVRCLYYGAAQPPLTEPILVLNGDGTGPINNLCVPTNVHPAWAPPGQSLISVTVLGSDDSDVPRQTPVEIEVRNQLKQWFGPQVDSWQHLRTYDIPYALPDQTYPALAEPQRPVRFADGIYVCGDHRDNASIEGAMVSGRRAAEAVCHDLRAT